MIASGKTKKSVYESQFFLRGFFGYYSLYKCMEESTLDKDHLDQVIKIFVLLLPLLLLTSYLCGLRAVP